MRAVESTRSAVCATTLSQWADQPGTNRSGAEALGTRRDLMPLQSRTQGTSHARDIVPTPIPCRVPLGH